MAQDDLMTDNARSWVVAACCCFINLTFYGVSRLSGIMLVSATHTFHVSRASAAVPFSLSTAIRNLAGVFVGHLGHRFGVGAVVATGCLIASLGSGLCFFAQDIQWLTISWGAIFGFGFGLSTCLLPLAINQNFVKHNGTASGISYSGAYIGSFIFPPIVVWLMDSFGFQGTLLIISGSVLNVLVAALLLREPKSGNKRASSSSSQDVYCSDSYSDNKEVSVICKNAEFGDMWRQNINRAFLDSRGTIRDETNKPYFKSNNLHLLQESNPENLKKISEDEKCPTCNINNNTWYTGINIHDHHHLCNLFRKFKFESKFSKSEEFEKNSSLSTYLSSSANGCETSKCTNLHSSKNINVASTEGIAKDVPTIPKVYFIKLLDTRIFSKGKYIAKCRLKLHKLRKLLEASILKNRTPALKEFIQNDNVKLTSFKYLQSFLYPNLSSVCVSNQYFYLSKPQSASSRQDVAGENDQSFCCRNSITAAEEYSNTKEVLYSVSIPVIKTRTNIKPVLNGSLKENDKSLSFNNGQHIKRNYCDSSVKELNCTQLPSLANKISYDNCSSKSSIYDQASNSCKTEDSKSSFYVPSPSSELFLQDKSIIKKDSSSNYSKYPLVKAARGCFSDWLHMLREPMFTIIAFTMSIQTFIVVSIVTTIEDFAKDVGISGNRTHYALMALSVSNLVGTLSLGSITDRGYISRQRFLPLCFLGMSLSLVTLSLFAVSLSSLLCLIIMYGLMESGVIITFPILMKQFVKGERRQAVAIASSNVLSAPTVMLVPMLIGYFRDNIGCYSGLFYLLGGTSFICCLLWLVAPSICRKMSLRKKGVLNINDC